MADFSFFSKFLFPELCFGCRADLDDSRVLCSDCFARIGKFRTLFCGKCRARLPLARKICHRDFPYILGAATSYGNEVVKKLIYSLKFKSLSSAAEPLTKILCDYSEGIFSDINIKKFTVVPVPLAPSRLKERGFNQSEIIAGGLARHFKLELNKNVLIRTRETKPQSEQNHFESRFENVRGCFLAKKEMLTGTKGIVLIDDVTTSGATFLEASTALKEAGVRRIIALSVAMA
ncbi:MAG: competence protein [Parcubacteria group bacterium Gr01-1014_20]|nr:MAG: competence protein [Parcubacteria group bacterium Gr01-1014_20]